MTNYQIILYVALGTISQEVLHWYDLRNKLPESRVKSLFRAKEYWIVISLTVFITALSVFYIFYEEGTDKKTLFLFGAAFPLIFKKIVGGISKMDSTNLGDNSLRDYFSLYSSRV